MVGLGAIPFIVRGSPHALTQLLEQDDLPVLCIVLYESMFCTNGVIDECCRCIPSMRACICC